MKKEFPNAADFPIRLHFAGSNAPAKWGAGDKSPAGVVGWSPTVLRQSLTVFGDIGGEAPKVLGL